MGSQIVYFTFLLTLASISTFCCVSSDMQELAYILQALDTPCPAWCFVFSRFICPKTTGGKHRTNDWLWLLHESVNSDHFTEQLNKHGCDCNLLKRTWVQIFGFKILLIQLSTLPTAGNICRPVVPAECSPKLRLHLPASLYPTFLFFVWLFCIFLWIKICTY